MITYLSNLLGIDVHLQTALVFVPSDSDIAPSVIKQLSSDSQMPNVISSANHSRQSHSFMVQCQAGIRSVFAHVEFSSGAENVLFVVLHSDVEHFLAEFDLFPNRKGETVRAEFRVADAEVFVDRVIRLDDTLQKIFEYI